MWNPKNRQTKLRRLTGGTDKIAAPAFEMWKHTTLKQPRILLVARAAALVADKNVEHHSLTGVKIPSLEPRQMC